MLSAERKYETRFESICFFRRKPEAFPIDSALQEYHREPIAYSLALAELKTAVFQATRRRHPEAMMLYLKHLSSERRNRDFLGDGHYDAINTGLTWLQILHFWKTEIRKLFDVLRDNVEKENIDLDTLVKRRQDKSFFAWEEQFTNFGANVNFFCQHTGSEVDDLAPPWETINNLRKFASDRRQELAPLLEVNARLNKDLMSYKRINAALQTRHTIEKLTFELPDTAQYDLTDSGPKWQKLWNQIWADASGNVNNPFHNLWTQSKGQYARDNIRDKGRNLFADMSGEIHGYQRRRNKFDYEHFDVSAGKVARILHENPVIDQTTGDVDWAQEIRKYPVAWPDENNVSLTSLERLEGQIAKLQRRLNDAVEDRDREMNRQAEIEAKKKTGEKLRQQRR